MSSANNLIFEETLSTISFIYDRNKIGPRIVPCGVPDITGAQSEKACEVLKLRHPKIIVMPPEYLLPDVLFSERELANDNTAGTFGFEKPN